MYRKALIVPLTMLLLVIQPRNLSIEPLPHQLHISLNKPVSRGAEIPQAVKRVMTVTAYTSKDKGMNGKGITASGDRVQEGVTIAAPSWVPIGARIYIPALGKMFVVQDRGGAIKGNRLDLYMENRKEALKFGVQVLEVEIWE